jgi:hypothetical protein
VTGMAFTDVEDEISAALNRALKREEALECERNLLLEENEGLRELLRRTHVFVTDDQLHARVSETLTEPE